MLLVPASILLVVLTTIAVLLPGKAHRLYLAFLLAIGICLWIQGNLLVWNYGSLNGRSIDWGEAAWRGWIDGTVWALILGISVVFAERVNKVIVTASMALLVVQVALIGAETIRQPSVWQAKPGSEEWSPSWTSEFSKQRNVIQLVMDGLQSNVFDEIVTADSAHYAGVFDGFTFFKDASGHFQSTHFSDPAILSGKLYRNEMPMQEFFQQTLNGPTTINVLHDSGYEVDYVPPHEWFLAGRYDHLFLIPSPYGGTEAEYERSMAAFMMDLVLFRHAPHFVKRWIYNDQQWLFQGMTVHDERMKFRRFGDDAFLRDVTKNLSVTRERPVYKFMHLLSTHPPFVTDSNCEFAGSVLPVTRESMTNQIRCSLESVIAFLERLKEVGVYDSALIVIQADHGLYGAPFHLNDRAQRAEGYAIEPTMAASALPLLMVKAPGARGPMKVSHAPVMLRDLPATIAATLGLHVTFPGTSVFDVREDAQRLFDDRPDRPQRMIRRHPGLAADIAEQATCLGVSAAHSWPLRAGGESNHESETMTRFFSSLLNRGSPYGSYERTNGVLRDFLPL